jgi:hypothetical protein
VNFKFVEPTKNKNKDKSKEYFLKVKALKTNFAAVGSKKLTRLFESFIFGFLSFWLKKAKNIQTNDQKNSVRKHKPKNNSFLNPNPGLKKYNAKKTKNRKNKNILKNLNNQRGKNLSTISAL